MSDHEAAKLVRQGLSSPVTSFAMVLAIVSATVTATMFYVSVNNKLEALSAKVVSLETSDKARDAEMAKITTELRNDIQKMQLSLSSVETSLKFLVEAQRRRPFE